MIAENQDERNFWEDQVSLVYGGNRIKALHSQLVILHQVTPSEGLKRIYAIMANEVEKLLDK